MSNENFKPQLREVSLNISDIKCKTYKFGHSVGLIGFSGKYRNDENESLDALWMRWNIDQFCSCEHHYIKGVILDLRQLEYDGGNELATITDFENLDLFIDMSSCPPVICCIVVPDNKLTYQAFQHTFKNSTLATSIREALDKIEPVIQMKVDEAQFIEVDLTNNSNIICKAYLWDVPETNQTAGFLRLEGLYHRGSAGKGDAHHLNGIQNLFLDLVKGKIGEGMVMDLTKLDYVWGNDLVIFAGGTIRRVVLPNTLEHHKAYRVTFREEEIVPNLEQAFKEIAEIVQSKYQKV